MSRIWKTPQQVDVNQDPGLIPPATPRESLGVGFTDTVNTETTSSQTTGNIVNNIYITRTAGPGGRSGELQFNEGGAYIGDSGLFYDPNTDTLTTGTININQLNANGANLGSVNNLTILGGNNNNVLKTNGSGVVTWASAFPPDGSNSGKFLMTNGISQVWSNVSYANLVDVPANIATQSYVGNAIANLVDSSPAALNTLNELATALGNNANYATDITSILANKANITYVDNVTANITWANLSGKPTIPAEQINSDWTEINSLSKAFIQNKPTLGNISNINISGSSTQVLYGNGVFEYLPTGSGIALTDLSIGAPNSASGGGGLSYANSTGVFTYTPPVIPTSFSNLVNGSHTLSLGSTGKLTLPTTGIVRNGTDTAQVGSTTTIATDSNSGTGNQTPRVVDVPFSAPIISTYSPGSTITFQNGDIRTITGIVQQSGGGGYLDINYSGAPTTSNPEFPIILKTADYAAATTAPEWYFSTTGNLTLPNGAVIRDTAGDAIAFGQDAGLTTQGTGAVAIGTGAGYSGQGNSAVAIGYNAGVTTQGTQAVAIGINAGVTTQGNNSVAIGPGAGASAQGTQAVAIGTGAGEITQGNSAVAVGYNAGLTSQGNQAVAFGQNAGANSQAAGAVAIGVGAGQTTQQLTAVAVGDSAGYNTQGLGAVGVGAAAGFELQGEYAVALGYFAGNTSQGNSAVAIGKLAGNTNQGNNSIILNATGAALDQTTANTFTVKPVRQANTANAMYYDASTGEITYDTAGGGGNTGNVTFNDQAVVGTGDQVGSSGLYLAPGTESVGNLQYIRVRGGDVATHIHLDTGNNAYFDQYFGDDIKYVKLAAGGNVVIGTDDANGNSAQWTFGTNGNLTLPSNLVIGTGAGSGSRIFQYDDGLEIVGEGANSVVLMGWTANISAPDSVATIAMNYPSGGEGNILIAVGNNATTVHSWLFGNDGDLKLPAGGDIVDSTGNSVLGGGAGGGIALTDLSIGTDGTPTGGGNISYVNTTGVFTYTPPVIPDVSGFALTSDIPDVSGFVTGTPWTSEGYLTTITNIFDQALNTTNNVTFSSVITSNVQATNGSPARASPVAVGGAGAPLTIGAGDGGIAATGVNAGAGGNLTITAGDAGSDIGNPSWGEIGGTLVIRGGNSSRPYHGSDVQIHSGNAVTSPGAISLYTGTNQWTFGKTGNLTLPVGGNILDSTGTSVLGVNIFNQNLNTSNNVTFNSVITNNVHGTTGSLVTVAGGPGTSIPNSIVFDGSTSFMSVPASSDFAIGVTYTIEFRIYLTATSSPSAGPWIIMTQEASDLRIHLLISAGKFQWNTSAGNSQRITEPTAGQWVHVALVNTAGTQTIYYDGIEQISLNALDGTPGSAGVENATQPLVFGRYGSNNYQYLPAKLSGIRISKVARYPAAFTPPTEVFVSDSNTLLLMNVLASQEYIDSSSYARTITNTATTIGTIPGIGLLPGNLVASAGSQSWIFSTDGNLTLPNSATIIAPSSNDLTVRVTGQYNICTVVNPGSGYEVGNSTSLVTGGSGTGMVVGYGYGLSGQIVSVGVTTAGTGYLDGEVLTMSAGNGTATFVITKYNSNANPNTNTAPSDWIFDTTNNLTLPLGGDIKDSTGNSVLSDLIALTDLSIGTDGTPTGGGNISYANSTGVFTYTPPVIPDVSGFALTSDIPDVSGFALTSSILAEPAFTVKTTDFNATAGSRYGFDTTAGVVTATLPASPSAGDAIYFADASGTTSTNNFIIARNSRTIMGSASNMTVNVNDQSFGLFYNGTTWRVY